MMLRLEKALWNLLLLQHLASSTEKEKQANAHFPSLSASGKETFTMEDTQDPQVKNRYVCILTVNEQFSISTVARAFKITHSYRHFLHFHSLRRHRV